MGDSQYYLDLNDGFCYNLYSEGKAGQIKRWKRGKDIYSLSKGLLGDPSLNNSDAGTRVLTAIATISFVIFGSFSLMFISEIFDVVPRAESYLVSSLMLTVVFLIFSVVPYLMIVKQSKMGYDLKKQEPLVFRLPDGALSSKDSSFPVAYLPELYNALLKVEEAKEMMREAEKKKKDYENDQMSNFVQYKLEERKEHLDRMVAEKNGVLEKIEQQYADEKEEKLNIFLSKS